MIRLACTNCREVLTIDDAFAGGVCRCQHCGTIQTVPAAASAAANEVVAGGPNLGGGRNGSTYGGAGAHSGTGLDELAGAVASSGLSSRRLRRPDAAPAAAGQPAVAKRPNLVPLFAVAGVVIVGLIAAVVYLATRSPVAPADRGNGPALVVRGSTPTPPAATGPAFCGSPLTGDTVVYVLDRGAASQEVFAPLKEAALRSAASLGSGRHFQIVFWDNAGNPAAPDTAAYPPVGTAYATKENVDAARHQIDDVVPYGQTDVKPALALALTQHPDTVVIATAKGWTLDEQWVKDVVAARGASPARLDTFAVGGAPAPEGATTPPLKQVADQTGGTFAEVSNADLKAAGD